MFHGYPKLHISFQKITDKPKQKTKNKKNRTCLEQVVFFISIFLLRYNHSSCQIGLNLWSPSSSQFPKSNVLLRSINSARETCVMLAHPFSFPTGPPSCGLYTSKQNKIAVMLFSCPNNGSRRPTQKLQTGRGLNASCLLVPPVFP